MNEYVTVWQSFFALIGVSVASLLYSLGGRSNKVLWRRILSALVLASVAITLSALRHHFLLLQLTIFPLLFVGFSMGYGGDAPWYKVVRRTIYALGVVSSGLVFCLTIGGNAYILLVPHIGVGLWSVWLGTRNPLEAAAEESLICTLLNVCLVFYPFVT